MNFFGKSIYTVFSCETILKELYKEFKKLPYAEVIENDCDVEGCVLATIVVQCYECDEPKIREYLNRFDAEK